MPPDRQAVRSGADPPGEWLRAGISACGRLACVSTAGAAARRCRQVPRTPRPRSASSTRARRPGIARPLGLGAERRSRCALVRRPRGALGDRCLEPPRQPARPAAGAARSGVAQRRRAAYTLVARRALARAQRRRHQHVSQERIPVTGGDLLGLRRRATPAGSSCTFTAAAGNTIRHGVAAEPPPAPTSRLGSTYSQRRLNVTARLEPDADVDGFGDETQDLCPAAPGCQPVARRPDPGRRTRRARR